MNLSVMVPGMLSGWLADRLGYEPFFYLVLVVTIPVILLSLRLPFAHSAKQEAAA